MMFHTTILNFNLNSNVMCSANLNQMKYTMHSTCTEAERRHRKNIYVLEFCVTSRLFREKRVLSRTYVISRKFSRYVWKI